jgi:hypothetical protein
MRQKWRVISLTIIATVSASISGTMAYGKDADELAKNLANPVAGMISLPLQQSFDFGCGTKSNGWQSTTSLQPVIPIALNAEWSLISRTIMSPVDQERVQPKHQAGFGHVVRSLFIFPSKATESGLIWGVGPEFFWFRLRPTHASALKNGAFAPMRWHWCRKVPRRSALGNHIWTVAGHERRQDASTTVAQPFISCALGRGASVSVC